LPLGSFIPPQDGKIICSDRGTDKGTCYLVTNGKKAGFTSETVFKQLGYNFAYAIYGDVSFLISADNINNSSISHPSGSLVNIDGTIYLVASNVLLGLPDWQTLEGWGYRPTDIVMANQADRLLPREGVVTPKTPGEISPPVSSAPTLILSTTFANFNYTKGSPVPSGVTAHISNNSSLQDISYMVSVPNQLTWLNSVNNHQLFNLGPLQSAGIGISIDPSNLEVGTYESAIIFTGNFSNSPAKIDVTLEVNNYPSSLGPQILTTSLPDATVGAAYSYQLTASGGTAPYTWSAPTVIMPDGSQGTNCCIFGVNTDGMFSTQSSATVISEAGNYIWTFEVADVNGKKTNKVLNLTIKPAATSASFQINTTQLPVAMEDETYSAQIHFNYTNNGTNYASNATFSGLPPGITTGSASGPNTTYGILQNNPGSVSLTGNPTASGTYEVTLTLDDQHGATATQKYNLVVTHQ
jgi:hypothetical protein